jgi:hydroxymethylglutaryl-CoA reductase
MPYGVAPNMVINGKTYCVPMVIEESSVVAAASSAAKYWMNRGGFKAEVISTTKIGQVHFMWKGASEKLTTFFEEVKNELLDDVSELTASMEARGGGVKDIELLDFTQEQEEYYQIKVYFETCDSMGANFINSVLEALSKTWAKRINTHDGFDSAEQEVEIVMSILSNYTPDCIVRASVSCAIKDLDKSLNDEQKLALAKRFETAVNIAHVDSYRATTHNKGIYNGVDAVVLATGNDFRAIEACGHTYASRTGKYISLSHCEVKDGMFNFWLELPLAVGTVGGLTKLHPMAKRSLDMLGNPNAEELMMVIAATGLAQNFAAIKSLVTTGIQKGHMKMHLLNILSHLEASEKETELTVAHFKERVISFSGVRTFLDNQRGNPSVKSRVQATK